MNNQDTKLTYTHYSIDRFSSIEISSIEEFLATSLSGVKWLDVVGIKDHVLISNIANGLNLHSLVLKDILNVEQNPKITDYDEYLFIVAKTSEYNNDLIETKQISFILFKDMLITFREEESEIFSKMIDSVKEMVGLRKNGADDLLYFLLDLIVDNYFKTIESMGERIDDLEDYLLDNPNKEFLTMVYSIKRQLIYIRSMLYHMRNVISSLSKNEYDLIDGRTVYYLRDINDQIVQIIDIVETYRDICSNMLDAYLSNIGNKTNEVMKVLTIFSTIFIPLTFISGVYGMNFKYFPELNWKYSYLGFWTGCFILIGFMIRFFKKKGWM